jgi:glycosyltransferase involved in cell wall biosynthesis
LCSSKKILEYLAKTVIIAALILNPAMYILSIIIPVYNEEKTIDQILAKLTSTTGLNNDNTQFIIVNDGSTDSTTSLLQKSPYRNDPRFVFIQQTTNRGKGAAILTGLQNATGTYTIIQDADLEYNPQNIVELLQHAQKNNLSVVYGSRILNKNNQRGKFSFYWGGIFLSFLTNLLYKQEITDEATCYKLFKTDLLKSLQLTCQKFEFCPEVTALISKKKIKIAELPIDYQPRAKEEGKKINFRDGISAIWTLLRLRFEINNKYIIATLVSFFILSCYFLTWGGYFLGYEEETAKAATALLQGKYQIKRAGFGAVILYLPFVAFGKLFLRSKFDRLLTFVPIFYSAITVGFIYLSLLELRIKKHLALITTIIIGLGSLIWPYSKIGMEYQTTLVLSIIILSLIKWKNTLENKPDLFPLASTIFVSWLTITKSYGIVFLLPFILFVGQTLYEKGEIKRIMNFKYLAKLILPSILLLALTIVLNMLTRGRVSGAYNLAHEFQIWYWWEGFWGVFFSFGRSILVYNPILILTFFYFKKFHLKYRALSLFILTGFGLLLLITAPFSYWSDETLSIRKLVPIIPFLFFPLVIFLENTSRSKIKKAAFAFLVLISFYIQFINSLYSYWNILPFLRSGNTDSVEDMRYIPQFSHVYLHHLFFLSYLSDKITGHPLEMKYQKSSWMRCCFPPKTAEVTLTKIDTSLARFETPNIFIIRSTTFYKKIILLTANLFFITLVGFIIACNLANSRKTQRVNSLEKQPLV